MFSTWFPLLMWIKVEQVLKLANLTNRLNIQNHVWAVKFRPETEKKKWKWLHMMWFSCRIMKKHVSIDFEMSFMSFGWKYHFFNLWWMSESHGVRWKKSFWIFVKTCFELRKQVKLDEKLSFILRKVLSLEKLKLNPLLSRKSQVNSHSQAPLTLSKAKWCKWGSEGRNYGFQ
jgi:hypothetical protein